MLLAEAQGLSSVCPGADKRDGDDEQHGKVFTPSMSWRGGSGGRGCRGGSRGRVHRQGAKDFLEGKVNRDVKTRLRHPRQSDNSLEKKQKRHAVTRSRPRQHGWTFSFIPAAQGVG